MNGQAPQRPTVKLTFLALVLMIRMLRSICQQLGCLEPEIEAQTREMIHKLVKEINR